LSGRIEATTGEYYMTHPYFPSLIPSTTFGDQGGELMGGFFLRHLKGTWYR
jgi:hypothetical protein